MVEDPDKYITEELKTYANYMRSFQIPINYYFIKRIKIKQKKYFKNIEKDNLDPKRILSGK